MPAFRWDSMALFPSEVLTNHTTLPNLDLADLIPYPLPRGQEGYSNSRWRAGKYSPSLSAVFPMPFFYCIQKLLSPMMRKIWIHKSGSVLAYLA